MEYLKSDNISNPWKLSLELTIVLNTTPLSAKSTIRTVTGLLSFLFLLEFWYLKSSRDYNILLLLS